MKKIISILLTVTILSGCIPVFATGTDISLDNKSDMSFETENVGTSEPVSPIKIGEVFAEDNKDDISEPIEYEPIVHEETITEDIEFPEDSEEQILMELPDQNIFSLFSSSGSGNEVWKSICSEQFGADYLKPYEKREDGQKVTGNTNRLVIEETDLTLPGKNGLDVVIKRRHDNQDYNEAYSYSQQFLSPTLVQGVKSRQYRYIYRFKNKATNEALYVGFLTVDELYTYMYDGVYLSDLKTQNMKLYKKGTETIHYYNFEYVADHITTDTSKNYYEYDSSFDRITDTQVYDDGASCELESRPVLYGGNYVGLDWKLVLPEAYLYGYNYETDSSGNPKVYKKDYAGAFRDMNGNVYTMEGYDEFIKYSNRTEYTSKYYTDDNVYLKFESLYTALPLYENGPEYNFVVYDSTGLTYYFYDKGMKAGSDPSGHRKMYILAVKDEYDNMIRYEYDDYTNNNSLKRIIDTYGREINISKIDGGRQISYYDDVDGKIKSITYKTETKNASELDNDSPIKEKDISRFTVINEEGESTIYDARETEVLNYYYSSQSGDIVGVPDPDTEQVEISYGYNIERIKYPTGAETRYRYKCLYPVNYYTKIRRGVYAVEASYDIVDGKNENYKEYSFSNASMKVTSTCLENDVDRKTVTSYNADGLATETKITPKNTASPYKKTTYTYTDSNKPSSITTDENGTKNTVSYSYQHSNVLSEESNDLQSVSYNYHTVNDNPTDKISKITYKKKNGSSYVEDYHVETELTSDGKSIEYEKTIQNNIVKSQKKYEYDSEGNVTAIKQWTDDTNSDGVLDEKDDIITLSNIYTTTDKKTRNMSSITSDVLNADGDNEGNITSEYSYNIYGSPISQKDSYGTVTTIEYDDLNRPVKYNLPNGGTQQIEYNTAQKYTIVTDPEGVVTKYEVDGFGRNKAKYIKDGTSYKKVEEYTYDKAGRLDEKIIYRDETHGTKEEYQYDALNRLIATWIYDLSSSLLRVEVYSYENTASQSIITKAIAAANAPSSQLKSYYDQYGRLIKTENISPDATLTTLYENDYLGRVTKETDPNGNSTTYEYTYDGQISKHTNAKGDSVSTVYDLAGQAVSVTDAKGNTTNTKYDKLGRAIKVTTPFDDTVSGETKTYYDKNSNVVKTSVKRSQNKYQTEEFKYDNMGNLLANITNDGTTDIVTQYKYDKANRITKMITGLSAYSENPTGGAVTQYSYNNQGYLAQTIDPMGLAETYNSYDYAGNLLSVTDKNYNTMHNEYGPHGLKKSYFENSPETKEYTYNDLGQVTNAKSINANEQTVEESYSYDPFGRLISSVSNDGSVQNYTYDANSNVATYELVEDEVVKNSISYEYNNLNQLTKLASNGIMTSYTYDANGNLTQKALHNGVTTNYTYNKAGLMTYMETKKGSKTYYYDCRYLLNGLLSDVYMPYDGDVAVETNEHKIKHYSYDDVGRLTGDYVTNGAGQPLSNMYQYDLRGNRTTQTSGVPDKWISTTTDYEYDLNNRLTKTSIKTEDEYNNKVSVYGEKYYYDDNGNMTAKQSKQTGKSTGESSSMILSGHAADTGLSIYRYDAFNRLTNYNSACDEASYEYNANNLRASKTVNRERTNFVWNGQNLAAENKSNNVNTYTYDMTGVHIANQNGNVMSYIKDYHGNIVGRTTAAGEMVEEDGNKMDYDAFGNQWKGDTPSPFGYCGEYYDNESGLIYLRNRYYDSTTGRFINEDPTKDGNNWYCYGESNPIMFIDPLGLKSKGELLSVGGGSSIDIMSLQLFLNAKGYTGANGSSLSVDGQFGSNTAHAVKQYQKDNGLTVDGIVGDATWTKMGFGFDSISGNPYATMALQKYLNNCGYTDANGNPLSVDGVYGNNTKYAVKQFQNDNGLSADGIVGPVTMAATRKNFKPRKDAKKGNTYRQPTGSRERNVGHPNGEEHSRVPKGNGNKPKNNVHRSETTEEVLAGLAGLATFIGLLEQLGSYIPAI